MTGGVTTEIRDGQPVVVKRATTLDDIARLEHEASMLRAADHPGVIPLVALERDGAQAMLVTAVAGRRTLRDGGDAGLLAALAETIADLHDLGVVHGRIEPSHVIVAADGRPVLCGLAEGGRVADGADPAVDVRALGQLLLDLLETTNDRGLAQRLRPIGERAAAEGPASPSARSVAASLQQLDARPGHDRIEGLRQRLPAGPSRRPLQFAAAGATVIAVIAVALVTFVGGSDGEAEVAAAATTSTTPAPTTTSTVTRPTLVWPPPPADPVIVEADGARYEVGRPGDEVVLGDWDCDGTSTPALLRPSTGDVFVFADWADAGRDITVEATTQLPGASAITAEDDDGDGCHHLVVLTPAGPEVVR